MAIMPVTEIVPRANVEITGPEGDIVLSTFMGFLMRDQSRLNKKTHVRIVRFGHMKPENLTSHKVFRKEAKPWSLVYGRVGWGSGATLHESRCGVCHGRLTTDMEGFYCPRCKDGNYRRMFREEAIRIAMAHIDESVQARRSMQYSVLLPTPTTGLGWTLDDMNSARWGTSHQKQEPGMDLQPYRAQGIVCQQCASNNDKELRYCRAECTRMFDGSYVKKETFTPLREPMDHLHVTCGTCGYVFLMHTAATALRGADVTSPERKLSSYASEVPTCRLKAASVREHGVGDTKVTIEVEGLLGRSVPVDVNAILSVYGQRVLRALGLHAD